MERDASEGEGGEGEGSSGGFTFAALRAMLGRIGPVAELAAFLTNHKDFRISPDVADPTRAKGHILNDLRHHFDREVTEDHIAAADLCSLRFRKHTWTACKLTPRNEQKHASSSSSSGADPEQLARRLREEIGLFTPHHLCVQMHDGIIWMRLSIEDLSVATRAHRHITYFAYCPRSRAIFVSNVKASLLDIIVHALETALECQVEKTKLRAKNVQVLVDMMLNRDGQGPYRDYRADVGQQSSESRRPTPSAPPLPIVVEDADTQQRTEKHLFDTYGSSTMPALDRVDFRIVDSFRGGFDVGPRFECSVRFDGPNVLEGIRKLVRLGIAQPPLPYYLANLPSLCQNSFDLVNPDPSTGEQRASSTSTTGGNSGRRRKGKRKQRDEEGEQGERDEGEAQEHATAGHEEDEAANQRRPPSTTRGARREYGIVQMGEKRRGV